MFEVKTTANSSHGFLKEEVAEGRRNVVIKILMIFIIYLLLNVQCHKKNYQIKDTENV